jgi:hypothetical protein
MLLEDYVTTVTVNDVTEKTSDRVMSEITVASC